MNANSIIAEFNKIFIEQLENPDIKLQRKTTSADISEWDSLAHIQLVVAIEKHFNVKFTAAEILNFKNVGEMCDAIEQKTKGK